MCSHFCQGDNFALFLAAAAAVVLTKLFFFDAASPVYFRGGGADAGLRSHVLTGSRREAKKAPKLYFLVEQ